MLGNFFPSDVSCNLIVPKTLIFLLLRVLSQVSVRVAFLVFSSLVRVNLSVYAILAYLLFLIKFCSSLRSIYTLLESFDRCSSLGIFIAQIGRAHV